MSLLGCLLASVLGLFIFAFALLGGVLRFLTGLLGLTPPHEEKGQRQAYSQQQQTQRNRQQTRTQNAPLKEKIFERDSSEYVDFEDVRH
ncbi:MAG: DUF4834 family protein [Bacteroidales bacterium]|nr:DUF4834 family protein [Bacteroidales bacterium]